MNRTFIKTAFRHLSLAKKLVCASVLLASSFTTATAQLIRIGSSSGGSNTVNQYPTPFGNDFSGQRAQYLYRASDLIAAGLKP